MKHLPNFFCVYYIMATVRVCLERNKEIYGDEKNKVQIFLSGTLDHTVEKYTNLKNDINRKISEYVSGSIATKLWEWVSINFSYKVNGCPGLADVVYVITVLKAAKGEVMDLKQFYGDKAFPGLGQLLGSAHITNNGGIKGDTADAILRLQMGGRRMKPKSRRMHRSKKNKTYRRK